MAIKNNYLLLADVMHERLQPKNHKFIYKGFYLAFPLSKISQIKNKILAYNKPGIFSFYDKDHGTKDGSKLDVWIRNILKKENVNGADGEIILVTYPRVAGFLFNPVSFWFCLNKKNDLVAVLAEVNNTFGESHNYLITKDSGSITKDDWLEAKKVFHVSPFMEVKGKYYFRFYYTEEKIAVWLNYETDSGMMLKTYIIGERDNLNTGSSLKMLLRFPFITIVTLFRIHLHAVKLFIKGIKFYKKPEPPKDELTK